MNGKSKELASGRSERRGSLSVLLEIDFKIPVYFMTLSGVKFNAPYIFQFHLNMTCPINVIKLKKIESKPLSFFLTYSNENDKISNIKTSIRLCNEYYKKLYLVFGPVFFVSAWMSK